MSLSLWSHEPNRPDTTGPLHLIAGRRLLVLADVQNLTGIDWERLGVLLRNVAERVDLHAFAGDSREARGLGYGWAAHVRPGARANIDGYMTFVGGHLIGSTDADAVLAATGDGDLGLELAKGTRGLRPELAFFTLAMPASASHRLFHDEAPSGLIDGNLVVGMDATSRRRAA